MIVNYVELANAKFNQTKKVSFDSNFKEFVCKCYVKPLFLW